MAEVKTYSEIVKRIIHEYAAKSLDELVVRIREAIELCDAGKPHVRDCTGGAG